MHFPNLAGKKTATSILALVILVLPAVGFAGGGGSTNDNTLTLNKSTSTNNGSDQISVTMQLSPYYRCAGQSGFNPEPFACTDGSPNTVDVRSGKEGRLEVSGSGNTVSPAIGTADSTGKIYFTIVSTVAETKTIKGYGCTYTPCIYYGPAVTATFVTPAPAPAPVPKPAPVAAKPAPAPVAKVVEPPSAPATSEIKVDGTAVLAGQPIKTDLTKPLTLAGKTVAKGVVKLFIFSEPTETTVTADDAGNWTYAVTDLPPGDHHIEAEVTDPATGKTSARNPSVLAFTVTEKPKPAVVAQTVEPTKSKPATGKFIAAGAAVLVVLAVVAFFVLRNIKAKKTAVVNNQTPVAPIEPTEPIEPIEPVDSIEPPVK